MVIVHRFYCIITSFLIKRNSLLSNGRKCDPVFPSVISDLEKLRNPKKSSSSDQSNVSPVRYYNQIIGITLVFSCINICRVSRKLFEHEAVRPSVLISSEGPDKCKCTETNMCDRYSFIFYLFQSKPH